MAALSAVVTHGAGLGTRGTRPPGVHRERVAHGSVPVLITVSTSPCVTHPGNGGSCGTGAAQSALQ